MTGPEELSPGEAAELVEEWMGRLELFCAALEQQGFQVQRDGLSVRIEVPPAPGPRPDHPQYVTPEFRPPQFGPPVAALGDGQDLWLGSDL